MSSALTEQLSGLSFVNQGVPAYRGSRGRTSEEENHNNAATDALSSPPVVSMSLRTLDIALPGCELVTQNRNNARGKSDGFPSSAICCRNH